MTERKGREREVVARKRMPVDLESIDEKATIAAHRKGRAKDLETQRVFADIDAALFVDLDVSNPDGERDRAAKVKKATAMHKLAGTKPADFVEEVTRAVQGRIVDIESQLVLARDHAAHPEVWDQDKDQAERNVVHLEAALRAARGWLVEHE